MLETFITQEGLVPPIIIRSCPVIKKGTVALII
jgi:hypothetical protein